MKSISLLASLAAVSAICVSVSCSSKSDSGSTSTTGGTGATGGASTAGSGGTSTGTGGTSSGGSAGKSTGGSANTAGDTGGPGGDTGGPGGDTGMGATSCSTGVVFEGNPLWDDVLTGNKPAGQALLPTSPIPPIRNEAIAVIGTKVFVETEFEIWSTDTSVASPMISRFAGNEGASTQMVKAGVACKDTQFLVMRDMAAEPNGKLVVVDYVGGAVIEITDPGGPNCKSDWVAGTHTATPDPAQDYPLAQGDMDGPGATALFGGVGTGGGGIHKVAVDPAGNIYTYDNGTGKFKMIGTDAARTVSTIGVYPGSLDDNIMSLAFLGGKLYAVGVDGANDFMLVVDPAKYKVATPKANVSDIFRDAGAHFPEINGTNHQAIPSEIIADGDAFIVASQSQYIWRVGTDGTVIATLAGSGTFINFDSGFDPTMPHAAKDWQLVYKLSNADGGPWLALAGGSLFWSGGGGTGKNILKISCP